MPQLAKVCDLHHIGSAGSMARCVAAAISRSGVQSWREGSIGSSRLVVFGDSLSDNGNLFELIGQPLPPYWDGRSSNGPTYAEQLAQLLHVPLDDLAFGGAEASDSWPHPQG
jgi:hypothetical protein